MVRKNVNMKHHETSWNNDLVSFEISYVLSGFQTENFSIRAFELSSETAAWTAEAEVHWVQQYAFNSNVKCMGTFIVMVLQTSS